ncbi:MAG: alcohol dehydrogenase catalytic domain-containing protein [bacterium]|nr:alcohol dehydrogenase catalytic domain-containing protein [bacterium]
MLAAVLEGIRRMVLKELPKPTIKKNEVLVRVKACGICQTDYSAYTGRRTNWTPPMILGHEISGVIEEIGDEVENWKPGDEVIVSPVISCGECDNCRLGLAHYCRNGKVIGGEGQKVVLPGGFAEYLAVPTSVLYKKPKNVSFDSAALTEPLAGSYKGMIEYSNLRLGEDVVIIGAGAMGLLLLELAVAGGAGNIIVIDVVDERLKKAKELGATHTINSKTVNPKEIVYDIIPNGPDIVFESAGVLEAASLAFELARRGTRVNMFGVIIPGTIPVSPAEIHFNETRVDASFSVNPRVMTKAISLLEKGKVDPGKIITHRFPLTEIDKALSAMEFPDRIKVIINP